MLIGVRLNKKDEEFEKALLELTHKNKGIKFIFNYDKLPFDLTDIDILITNRLNRDELETANKLQYLYLTFTGLNSLPMEELARRHIKVVNTHAHALVVAERAFTLALSLLGRVVELHQQMTKGLWVGLDQSATWTSLRYKRCGIIGMGEIGQQLLQLLTPFNCQISTLERYKNKINGKVDFFPSILEVCEHSDIIFVSLPLTESTRNIIDGTILNKMKDQFLVNVGRGDVIHEAALYQALKENRLKGAAIDVWYQYPNPNEKNNYPSNYPFHELTNVILSPHCAGNTMDTKAYVNQDIIRNLEYFLLNNTFMNTIDFKNGY